MAKKFHETLVDFYIKRLPEMKKEAFERQKQTDNVVVWIAGLSSGAIALILAKFTEISVIDIVWLKISVGFFLLTILSAVIFRTFFYNLQQKESDVISNFEGYCFGFTCESYGPITINEHYTIEQIAESLKNDMGLDYDDWLEKDHLDRNFWIEHYQKWAEFWEKQEQEGIHNLAKAMAPLLGKLPEEVDGTIITEQDNTDGIKNLVKLRKISQSAYKGVMVSFLLAISTIAFGFFIS
jgi:hypothetical protein